MIPVGKYEVLSHFAEILAVLLTLLNLYPAIICEKFHRGKTGFLFCTAGIPICRNETFPRNRFNPPKPDEKVI